MPKSRSRFSLLGEQPPREPKPARPVDHAVDLARHDEVVLVQSLDLLGAERDRRVAPAEVMTFGLSNESPAIPDQKLDAAAAAIERVASLKQDYQQRIAAAAPADKEGILNEAIHALAKAVTDQGLSVDEYDSILEVAQNDPDVREKNWQRIRPPAK
jgi:hypothetical protein